MTLTIAPSGKLDDTSQPIVGPAVVLTDDFGGTSGRFDVAKIAARVFAGPEKAFVASVIAEGIEPKENFPAGPYPADKLTYKTPTLVEFATPAGKDGLGTAAGSARARCRSSASPSSSARRMGPISICSPSACRPPRPISRRRSSARRRRPCPIRRHEHGVCAAARAGLESVDFAASFRIRAMPFSGFGPQAVPFFKALAFHQTKDWFEANRAIYEGEIKGPLGDLVEDLAARFAKAKTPLKGDRKASLFRINRDVRFAKDKSPYKTNAGAVLSRTGAKNDPGMLYFHVAAEGCFAAAGF